MALQSLFGAGLLAGNTPCSLCCDVLCCATMSPGKHARRTCRHHSPCRCSPSRRSLLSTFLPVLADEAQQCIALMFARSSRPEAQGEEAAARGKAVRFEGGGCVPCRAVRGVAGVVASSQWQHCHLWRAPLLRTHPLGTDPRGAQPQPSLHCIMWAEPRTTAPYCTARSPAVAGASQARGRRRASTSAAARRPARPLQPRGGGGSEGAAAGPGGGDIAAGEWLVVAAGGGGWWLGLGLMPEAPACRYVCACECSGTFMECRDTCCMCVLSGWVRGRVVGCSHTNIGWPHSCPLQQHSTAQERREAAPKPQCPTCCARCAG